MKLYNYLFATLALAGVMTACSDDDSYIQAPESPGAYFPADAQSTFELKADATSVNVPIYRTEPEGTKEYSLVVTGDTELFTVPSTVTFEGSSLESAIVISYDPDSIVMNEKYNFTITVAEGNTTVYGQPSTTFNLVLPAPVVTDLFGTGTYYYSLFFNGEDPDLKCYKSYPETNPDEISYVVKDWGIGMDLNMKVSGYDADNYPIINIEPFGMYEHSTYGTVYMSDMYNYMLLFNGEEAAEGYRDASYFDPVRGVFNLCVIYFISNGGYFGNGYEYMALDGYPDYSVSVEYMGVFTDKDYTQTSAVASVTSGEDITEVKVACVAGGPENVVLADIASGAVASQSVPGNVENYEVRLPLLGPGQYTLVALGMDGEEFAGLDYVTFSASDFVVEAGNWADYMGAYFVDGWVLATIGADPYNYVEVNTAMVQKNLDVEGVFRVNPYCNEFYLYNELNTNTKGSYIVIDASDPDFVVVEKQYSGLSVSMGGIPWVDWYISDGDYLLTTEDGLAPETIIEAELNSTYDASQGIINLPIPFFGSATEFGYVASEDGSIDNLVPSEFYMDPELGGGEAQKIRRTLNANNSIPASIQTKVSFKQDNTVRVDPVRSRFLNTRPVNAKRVIMPRIR